MQTSGPADVLNGSDLAPARWIWLPSQRTLPNTVVLFRREVHLEGKPVQARGWISADSRYRLTVNGQRVQWGPAPCDPRWLELDPVDLVGLLVPGDNVVGAEVLFFGQGDGTWVAGKPGFLFRLEIVDETGRHQVIASDASWQCAVDRAHRPGQYKRWFLRALQEEFDARRHPRGWDAPGFAPGAGWGPAAVLPCAAEKPPATGGYHDYLGGAHFAPDECGLVRREIPALAERRIPPMRLADAGRVRWLRDPEDWFQFRVPGSFEAISDADAARERVGGWDLAASGADAAYATFEFEEQMVGWPYLTVEAPAGTVIELICQESHDPARTNWLDSHFFTWTRLICADGVNTFETFDFESLRWLQVHVRGAGAAVVIREVGVRRRVFDWPQIPQVQCSEPPLQRLMAANINTLLNSAQETCVDGMGRERQQYSGDGAHQLSAIRYLFGETRLPRRFLRTFSQGITPDGYFLDCWPAFDRMVRVAQRQIGATPWGPLLDHGVGFVFDCWQHVLETGDLAAVEEPYTRLLRFAHYLSQLAGPDGLLPVEGFGTPTVWLDHQAYLQQRHKACAFNLYVAAMYRHALAPLCQMFGDARHAAEYEHTGAGLVDAVVQGFWSRQRGLYVANLPWLDEEAQGIRLCDRSLATAILFEQCPGGDERGALEALATCPPELGLSYPCNALWRYHALAKGRRIDVVLRELRERWAVMPSVRENNTIQEGWTVRADSHNQWSHCAVAPIRSLFMDIAGIRPTAPGFQAYVVEPQLGDLSDLTLTAHTVQGPIRFRAERDGDTHVVEVTPSFPASAELVLPSGADCALTELGPGRSGLRRFVLPTDRPSLVRIPLAATGKG